MLPLKREARGECPPYERTNEAFHSTADTRCACRSEMSERKCQCANGDQAAMLLP